MKLDLWFLAGLTVLNLVFAIAAWEPPPEVAFGACFEACVGDVWEWTPTRCACGRE